MAIELELKALTNDAEKLKQKIETTYDKSQYQKNYSEQLNHYFKGDSKSLGYLLTKSFLMEGISSDEFNSLISAIKLAVRTRWDSNQGTLLIFKYSIIDENAENGTIRKELEKSYSGTLKELDSILLQAGFTYQSKWSRNRTEYALDSGWKLLVDLNAGYGGILEVEYLPTEEEYAKDKYYLLEEADRFLSTLGLKELDADLLKEMFAFYSSNYEDFYGKDKLIWGDSRFKFNSLPTNIY
jgi:adenylate cyclase class IV